MCAQGKQMEARELETSQAFGTHLTDFSQRKGCIQSHLDVICKDFSDALKITMHVLLSDLVMCAPQPPPTVPVWLTLKTIVWTQSQGRGELESRAGCPPSAEPSEKCPTPKFKVSGVREPGAQARPPVAVPGAAGAPRPRPPQAPGSRCANRRAFPR